MKLCLYHYCKQFAATTIQCQRLNRGHDAVHMRANLLSGLLNSVWTALITFAVVPFYIDYLGIEAYGVIGFFITLQSVLLLLDMGLSPTVSREVARTGAAGSFLRAANFLHSVAIVYWILAIAIFAAFLPLAPLIATYWLDPRQFDASEISSAVLLMGLVIAVRFPHSIYRGALIGAERLVLANTINMVMITVSSVGAILVLALINSSLVVFFLWQAICGAALTFLMHRAAWRTIVPEKDREEKKPLRFEKQALQKVWRFTAGMTVVGIGGVVLLQLDKILISATLPLEDYGAYMVAALAGSVFSAVFMPVFNVIYPRMVALVESQDTAALISLYRKGSRALGIVLFPLSMVLGVYSEPFVALWTGDHALAEKVAPLILCLSVGFAINGVMHFPYALQLAYGRPRIALYNSVALMIVMVPLTLFLIGRYGLVGGAASWMIVQIIYLFLGCWLTHQTLLVGTGHKWLLFDVGIPLTIASIVGIFVKYLLPVSSTGVLAALILSGISGLLAVSLSLLASPVFLQDLKRVAKFPRKHSRTKD
jgi:O-antigen/teichoic acid export membrane protein